MVNSGKDVVLSDSMPDSKLVLLLLARGWYFPSKYNLQDFRVDDYYEMQARLLSGMLFLRLCFWAPIILRPAHKVNTFPAKKTPP